MSAHLGVGYDYARAVSELLELFTYKEIAKRLGYRSVGSVTSIRRGKIPTHPHGEALWVFYTKTFGRRPSLTDTQKIANEL